MKEIVAEICHFSSKAKRRSMLNPTLTVKPHRLHSTKTKRPTATVHRFQKTNKTKTTTKQIEM